MVADDVDVVEKMMPEAVVKPSNPISIWYIHILTHTFYKKSEVFSSEKKKERKKKKEFLCLAKCRIDLKEGP